MLFTLKTDDRLNSISTADLFWDKKSKRWTQRPSSLTKTDSLEVSVSICRDDMAQLSKQQLSRTVRNSKIVVNSIADTGCSILCAGDNIRSKLGIPRSCLLNSNVTLRTAEGKKMTVYLFKTVLPFSCSTYCTESPKCLGAHLITTVLF